MTNRKLRTYLNVFDAIIKNRTNKVPLPRVAHFIPTWDCNLHCEICTVWKRGVEEELNTYEMKVMLAKLKSLDIIKIVGGEPFKRDDLTEIVNFIKEEIDPYILQIITNGVLTDKIIHLAEVTGYPALHLRVSLDGFKARHESLRGRPEIFEKIITTLKELVKLRKEKKFSLGINFNLTDETIDDLKPMLKFTEELGVDLIPGIPVTPFLEDVDIYNVEKKIIKLERKEEARKLINEVNMGAKKGLGIFEKLFLHRWNMDILNKQLSNSVLLKFKCLELRSLMYIFPNGDLVICGLRHSKVGNLFKQSFDEVWFGERANELRKEVDNCPGCMQAAVEIFSRLYYGKL